MEMKPDVEQCERLKLRLTFDLIFFNILILLIFNKLYIIKIKYLYKVYHIPGTRRVPDPKFSELEPEPEPVRSDTKFSDLEPEPVRPVPVPELPVPTSFSSSFSYPQFLPIPN